MREPASRSELEQHQLTQLKALVDQVAEQNPFYGRLWRNAGIRTDLVSLDDFRTRFPHTRKPELVQDQAEHPPYGTNLTFPIERYTRCHGTSGTSGRPLRWLDTPESWEWMLGNWRRVYSAAGVKPGDRIFFAFSFGPFLGFWTAFEAALSLGCLCLPGGGLTTPARLRSIIDQQATVLCCTPTYALHLGHVAAKERMDATRSRITRIIVAGEPGGSIASTRRAIEEAWGGARVFDHHGMTEVGPVSYECPVQAGVLHVMEGSYVAEVVDPGSGSAREPGGLGELILTTLGRLGSPLIRYSTGDLVQARPTQQHACGCGTWDLALEGGVLGRTDDMVVIRGVNVFPSAIDEIIRNRGGIEEYRAEVCKVGALSEVRIEIEPERGNEDPAAVARDLEVCFQNALGLRIEVRAVQTGTLPRFEMKARRWTRTA